ncbi:MAG: ABC transporter permease [Lactobacillales bacterium]|nr:ABC transporter permease [Lactobacillales bacterium]
MAIVSSFISPLFETLFLWVREDFVKQGIYWLGFWGQSAFYYSQIFFPILISILVSISCQMEHQHKNWQRMVIMPISPYKLVLNKFMFLICLTFLSELFFLILFFIAGLVMRLPIEDFNFYISSAVYGWIGSFSIISVQIFFSIKLKDFTTPIIIATICSIGGMLLLFINENMLAFYPYTQIVVGMRARKLIPFIENEEVEFIMINFLFVVVGLLFSGRQLSKIK